MHSSLTLYNLIIDDRKKGFVAFFASLFRLDDNRVIKKHRTFLPPEVHFQFPSLVYRECLNFALQKKRVQNSMLMSIA